MFKITCNQYNNFNYQTIHVHKNIILFLLSLQWQKCRTWSSQSHVVSSEAFEDRILFSLADHNNGIDYYQSMMSYLHYLAQVILWSVVPLFKVGVRRGVFSMALVVVSLSWWELEFGFSVICIFKIVT